MSRSLDRRVEEDVALKRGPIRLVFLGGNEISPYLKVVATNNLAEVVTICVGWIGVRERRQAKIHPEPTIVSCAAAQTESRQFTREAILKESTKRCLWWTLPCT